MRTFPLPVVATALLLASSADAAGALETLAPELARSLGTVPAGTVVVVSPLASDLPAPKGDELAVRLGALIAGKLGGTTRAHPQAAQLSTARAVSGKGGALVYISVEISKGELRASADLYPVLRNGWDRIRVPAPPPRAHGFATAPLDAEARAFLPPIVLEQASVHKVRHDEGDVIAMACGDVDADGGMELVLVSRARVAMGHVRGGHFLAEKFAPWGALAPRLPVPLREPLAGAEFQPKSQGGGLFVGTSDRGGVSLDANLAVRSALRGLPVGVQGGDACATLNLEESAYDGAVASCSLVARDQVVRLTPPTARFDAVGAADVVAASGKTRAIAVAREPGGKLKMRLGEETRSLDGVGAQVAVGDLDQDGVPEIITSMESGEDAIAITSWDGGEPRLRRRIAAPAGVRALAVCAPELRGIPAVVAVIANEVWIVR
ncbi:MAG: hypothetical protein ABIP39_00115 [Polyangiaceae bacterium]